MQKTTDDDFLRSLGIAMTGSREYFAIGTLDDIARDQHALRQEKNAHDMVLALDRLAREHDSYGSRYTNAAFHELLYQLYHRAMSESRAELATSIESMSRSFVSRVSMEPRGLVDPMYAKQLVDGMRKNGSAGRDDGAYPITISP
ncbi:TPA: hypothetical protein HA251_06285 [Candidatus Woesearchaeota archaeon]|nr:hypothetical protein [Candidatus Woesearchaeota archaeon]